MSSNVPKDPVPESQDSTKPGEDPTIAHIPQSGSGQNDSFSTMAPDSITMSMEDSDQTQRFQMGGTRVFGKEDTQAGKASDFVKYFGKYELLSEIARGGMGIVYRARQVNLNRIVALKMILSGAIASPEDVKRFYIEAEAAASLEHPNIVSIYEIGEHDGQHFFSMALVDGKSLLEPLKDGPLAANEAAAIMAKVAEAIDYAHSKGVIHRDIKPANILIDSKGDPKITDFGLARIDEGDSNLTRTGLILGTPSFMPPEQAAGRVRDIGPLSDVYSIGATMYSLITGQPAFLGSSPLDTLNMVLSQPPKDPRSYVPSIPKDLQTICLKCLEKNPRDRYPSAGALSSDLNNFLNGEPITARPPSPMTKLRYWVKRHPSLVRVAASVFLTLMIVGSLLSFLLWRTSEVERGNAVMERAKFEVERRNAETAMAIAEEQRQIAEKQRQMAEIARQRAETALEQGRVNAREAEILKLKLAEQQATRSGDAKEEASVPVPKIPK